MLIRNAHPADIARIVEIDAMFYGEHGYGRYVVRQFLDLFSQSVFVAEKEGKIAGYAVVGVEAFSRKAWLLAAAVERCAQRQGIGEALLNRCLQYCEKNRIKVCYLTVDPDNAPAVSLYCKHGFAADQGPSDYFDDGHLRIVMRKDWA